MAIFNVMCQNIIYLRGQLAGNGGLVELKY